MHPQNITVRLKFPVHANCRAIAANASMTYITFGLALLIMIFYFIVANLKHFHV